MTHTSPPARRRFCSIKFILVGYRIDPDDASRQLLRLLSSSPVRRALPSLPRAARRLSSCTLPGLCARRVPPPTRARAASHVLSSPCLAAILYHELRCPVICATLVVCSWSVMARLTLPRGGASRAGDGGAERGGRAANCRDRRASRRAVPRRRREPSCARLGAAPPTELALASAMRRDAARASSVVQRARVRVRASVAARRIRSTRDGQAHAFSWCSLVLNVVVWP